MNLSFPVLAVLLPLSGCVATCIDGHIAQAAEPVADSATPGKTGSDARHHEEASARREKALGRLRQAGGNIATSPVDSNSITAILLAGKAATDAALADVGEFPELLELAVSGPAITDAGLKHLEKLGHVERLDLQYAQVTDMGLAQLRYLTALSDLRLDGNCHITDAGLRALEKLVSLRSLDLTFTRVSDQAVESLQRALPKAAVHRRYHFPEIGSNTSAAREQATASTPWRLDRIEQRFPIADPMDVAKNGGYAMLAILLDHEIAIRPTAPTLWRLLAWNFSYNLAATCDNVRERYWWMKQGILVLVSAAKRNPAEGRVIWDLGWFVGNRLGRCDDAEEIRKLFADDAEMHSALLADIHRETVLGPSGKPDNWLVARQWFLRAEPFFNKIDAGITPIIALSDAPICQIYYASALENEGTFGDPARKAWKEAETLWNAFGDRTIPVSEGTVRMNDCERQEKEAKRLRAELDAMAPGLRARMEEKRRLALPKELQAVLRLEPRQRSPEQWDLAIKAECQMEVDHATFARQIEGPNRSRAIALAKLVMEAEILALHTRREKMKVNYDAWKLRCRVEQLPDTIAARQLLYQAQMAVKQGRLDLPDANHPGAKQLFEKGFGIWKKTVAAWPLLKEDVTIVQDLSLTAGIYRRRILAGRPLPNDFPLKQEIEEWDRRQPADLGQLRKALNGNKGTK